MKMKKITSLILTLSLLLNLAAVGAVVAPPVSVQAQEELPEAAFLWDFENVQGTDAGNGAALKGTAAIALDSGLGSKVLSLPGGSAGTAYMQLPEGLFTNVGSNGFTISMWVNPSNETGDYTKFFDASNTPLGQTGGWGNGWASPDFALAAGGSAYDVSIDVGEAGTTIVDSAKRAKLKYATQLQRDSWQYLTVSVKPDEYKVFLNGESVGYSDITQDGIGKIATALPALFENGYINTLKYASLGQSFYTSDNDFEGLIDDFRFDTIALTDAQMEALYLSYNEEEEEPSDPLPMYSWDFENVTGTNAGNGATLENGAAVKNDEAKGKVLNLPGGSVNAGSMTLPQSMFENLGNEGFTISMWVKPSSATGNYTKFFNASNGPLGATYDGGNNWSSPDFAFAAGGSVYDMTLYVGTAGNATTDKTKLNYNRHLARDTWQHIMVSVSPDDYSVYINGENVTYQDAQDGTKAVKEILPRLFAGNYLATLKYVSIGRSFYNSDNDFQGMVDDVNVYGMALTAEQAKTVYDSYEDIEIIEPAVSLEVDMAAATGEIKHGATGFLYGLGEDNVPNVNLLTGLKPYMVEQNAPLGLQHPNGDSLNVANTFLEAGGDSIQIACPDIYANWPYEFESIPEYIEKLEIMVQQVIDAGLSDKVVYVPFNEPDGNWYPNITNATVQSNFFAAWKEVYDAIKAIDPDAKIAGSNLTGYNDTHMKAFVKFCAENDCIPEQVTWHVLQDSRFNSFKSDLAKYRNYEKEFWLDTGLIDSEREVVINEYADFTHLGVPGQLARWIGCFEDEKVSACLAYWHISNNLCDLAADNNQPNGAWWLYKWYGDMSGQTLSMTPVGVSKDKLYGVASLDDNKKISNVIFGGVDGNTKILLENITSTEAFKGADKVKIRLESTSWTGINGASDEPVLIREEVCAVDSDGNLSIIVEDMVAAAAYNITVTQAGADAATGVVENGPWRQTYEGEAAELGGKAAARGKDSRYACSGTGQAQNINDPGDSVTFHVSVPADGYYQYDMVYGAATGNNTSNPSSNDPKNAIQELSIDGQEPVTMILPNTLAWYMAGMHTEYIYLTAGEHALKAEATNSTGKATIDCVYLTYIGDEKALSQRQNVKTYEAELADFNVLGEQSFTNVTTESAAQGYSASGYVTGLNIPVSKGGGIRFHACVDENGLYDVTVRYASSRNGTMNYYLDNTALTLNNQIASVGVSSTGNAWKTVTQTIFLQKGINVIDLDASSADIAVDTLTVTKVNSDSTADTQTTIIEAEDCDMYGEVTTAENQFASDGTYVNQIEADADGSNAIELTYNAAATGSYKMIVYQSNKELFGRHDYNAQMVDRFITISVNGGTPFNVFFRNTYSDESFKSQLVNLDLNKGKNVITIYNDDSRTLKNGVGGVNTCVNYTPNLDRFEITPAAITDKSDLQNLYDGYKDKDQSKYTVESWTVFSSALTAVQEILDKGDATQSQIDEALQKLQDAVKGLTLKSEPDKSKLQAAYNANKNKKQGDYTQASWKTFAAALKEAKTVIEKSGATQSEITNATNKLNNASKGLIAIKVTSRKKVTLGIKETFKTFVSGKRKDCYFTSSNSKVAEVNAKGIVTARRKGTATITAVNKNGKAVTLKVTVKKAPSKIVKLNAAQKTLKKNQTFKIKVTLPKKTASHKITYKSSNKSVAAVSKKGKVTAKKKGTAIITVKTFNKKAKKIKIIVN